MKDDFRYRPLYRLTRSFLILLVLSQYASVSQAASESQLSALSTIGNLNGVALQCHYLQHVQDIKRTLIRILPRKREFGVWFEKSTNEGFLNFMQQQQTCPPPNVFSNQLESAMGELESVFR